MRILHILLAITLSATSQLANSADTQPEYGQNTRTGNYAQLNGIKMYYELYGKGEPILLIHGSGQSIEAMRHQIQYYAPDYQVIVADSRAHGKSDTGKGRLTYEQMADDWAALLDALEIEKADVLGWSDGGNIGLLMAVRHPEKVKKLAIMGANLSPGDAAVYSWAGEWVANESKSINEMLARGDKSQEWERMKQQFGLLREQPNIPLSTLREIDTPVLVMAGDRDIIRIEHTVQMFQNLPRAQLAIFPGETHYAPHNHPQIFNATTGKFFKEPFSMPDTKDLFQ